MRARGFTLIELVVTIAVSAVVVSMMVMFLVGPVRAYTDQTRRVELVDAADTALRLIARDLRGALPNSVRVTSNGGLVALELIPTLDAVRYRDGALGDPAQDLDLTIADTEFTTATPFTRVTTPYDSTASFLAIYNVGVPGADAYEAANVITPAATRIRIDTTATAGSYRVRLTPGMRFAWASPGKRVYLVGPPVVYLCDTTSGTLARWTGHPLASTPLATAAALGAAGATGARVVADLAGCTIGYVPGTPERAGMVTLSLRLQRDAEKIELLHQVNLPNAP